VGNWIRRLKDDRDEDFLAYIVKAGLCLTSDTTRIEPYRCRNYSFIELHKDKVLAAFYRHVLLEDLGTLVDEPRPPCGAVQVHDLLQDILYTSPDDGPPAKEEEIG
jgi:hypothetical protein